MSFSDSSFSAKLKAGWLKADLMKYYVLSEVEYNRIIACLEKLKENGNRPEVN